MLKKGESGAVDAAFVCVVMNNFFTITVTGAQAPLDASPLGCVPSASAAGALPAPPASGACCVLEWNSAAAGDWPCRWSGPISRKLKAKVRSVRRW